jgi:hypothetical protein
MRASKIAYVGVRHAKQKKLEKLKYITELTDRSDIIDDREERMLEEAIYEEIRHMKATERIKYIQRIKTSAASYSLGNLYVWKTFGLPRGFF